MSKDASTLVLRNYPDDDALKHPEKYSKALSFSPDIIPLYGAKADQSALVHPTSWSGFTGMPIVGGDVNNVYIRGYGSGGPYAATLRVVPSELILWPQVWSGVQPVPSGMAEIPGGESTGPYASSGPLSFRPPHTAGNAYSLIAHVFQYDAAASHEPMPSFDPKHLRADDFTSFLSQDKSFTFYNVIVADPTSKHVSANTRLRMYNESPIPLPLPVKFYIGWHEGAPAPAGLEVSLVDDRGKICIPRTRLSSSGAHAEVTLEPSYDGMLTLNIFSTAESAHFEPYSGLCLQVFKNGGILGSEVPEAAAAQRKPFGQPQLLGSLNVIFEPHSTRNLRLASPSAMQLRESKNCPIDDGCHCVVKPKDCAPIPTTNPAATGWWFRSHLNDTNNFPRGQYGYSPDIQLIGTDLNAPGVWSALQNPSVDYTSDNNISLVGGEDNYIFLRGHSTITDIDVETRIFAILGNPMLHPSQWPKETISGQVVGGGGPIDQQTISVPNSNQFYVVNRPLDIQAPPNPNPNNLGGPSWIARPHYCLVAEARQKRKCSSMWPGWPSDQIEEFTTVQDYANWCAACPLVCVRNVNWVPCDRKPGEKCLTWCCGTQLTIPECSFTSTFWTIIIECDSPIIPPGCKWTLTCEDNAMFPNGVCFENLPICTTQSPAYAGCHFVGAKPGRADLTLTVTWCDDNGKYPPPSVKFRLTTTEVTTLSPLIHAAEQPVEGSDKWPFYVGASYPYIGGKPNPSPLPTFQKAGLNTWPYPDSPEYVLGQVALAVKKD
ncbi:hypothetical protein EV363DRAFT_1448110 [Boletus edulis]|nr:hypothetical protein EV363DRAFT_1448110 [Boletus edulis]